MKRISVPLFLVLAIAICTLLFRESNSPLSDEALIKNFGDRKLAYERLRDLFLADGKILVIADWGVRTAGSVLTVKPPIAELSLARYEQYLTLLKDVGARGLSRSEAGLPEACIYVWSAGFAADTRHESVCWLNQPPPEQVARLNEIETRSSDANGKRVFVYRHLESNWYLERDE